MSTPELIELLRQTMVLAAVLALPVVASALAVGLVTGVLQMATGVQDATIGQVPRLLVSLAVFAAALPWILGETAAFGEQLFAAIRAL